MNFDVIQTANLGDHFDTSRLAGGGPLQINVQTVIASIVADPEALSALVAGIAAHAQASDLAALQQAGLKALPAMAPGDASAPVEAHEFFRNGSGYIVEAGEA